MTPWERVIRELSQQEPDRIPWGGETVSWPTADLILGRKSLTGMGGRQRIRDLQARGKGALVADKLSKDTYELARKLSMDLVPVHIPPPEDAGRDLRIISENEWTYGEEMVTTVDGNLLEVEVDGKTGDRKRHGMDDLKDLVEGREISSGELKSQSTEAISRALPLINDLKKKLEVAILFPVWNCFLTHPDWLPTFLKAFHLQPDLVMRFEKAQSKRAIEMGKAAIDSGCDVIGIGGDLAYRKGPLISPGNYRKFILPFMKRQSRIFHKKGAYSMIASDGNLMPIAEDYFINSGVDAAREIEPGPMDRGEVKDRFGREICLNGNVDCGRTLSLLSKTEVERETRECIRMWSPGGGHIMSSSNSINPNVKPENFLAMWNSIFKYGRHGKREGRP